MDPDGRPERRGAASRQEEEQLAIVRIDGCPSTASTPPPPQPPTLAAAFVYSVALKHHLGCNGRLKEQVMGLISH